MGINIDDYYNEIALTYNELHGEEQKKKANIILKELLKQKKSGRLLDIGGGTGIATELFIEHYDCILIDPSERLLDVGSYKMEKILAEAEQLPFAESKFDIIISLTALHHTELEKALSELKRVAKSDALVAISFLKKSVKLEKFRELFKKDFPKTREIEEDKDILFFNF